MMDGQLSAAGLTTELRAQLLSKCQVMIRFALSSGRELSQPIIEALDTLDHESVATLPTLMGLHNQLLRVVAPATPGGLLMVQEDERCHPRLHVLGPAPSIRYLMAAAIVFLLMFIGMSLFPEINRQTLSRDIFDSSGWQLLLSLTFLLSAAGMGAAFGALFEAYESISAGCYDTKFDSIYWARIGLGLVSGLLLAQLVPQNGGNVELLERPVLALLGGFSAAVVHRILQRLVSAMERIFIPEAKPDPVANDQSIRQRLAEEQRLQLNSLTRSFDTLLEGVAAGGSVSDARKGLLRLLSGQSGTIDGKAGVAVRVTSAGSAGERSIADVVNGDVSASPTRAGGTTAGAAARDSDAAPEPGRAVLADGGSTSPIRPIPVSRETQGQPGAAIQIVS